MFSMLNPRQWAAAFAIIAGTIQRGIGSSILTCVLLFILAEGYSAIHHNGEIAPGIRVMVTTDKELSYERQQEAIAVDSQAALKLAVKSDKVVNDILSIFLEKFSWASRARVGLVHDGMFSMTGAHLMHFSISHAAANPGHSVGDMQQNEPLSQWSDFLPAIYSNPDCIIVRAGSIKSTATLDRMKELNVGSFMTCGIRTGRGVFIGALFLAFDTNVRVPGDVSGMLRQGEIVAAEIGAALGTRSLSQTDDDSPN